MAPTATSNAGDAGSDEDGRPTEVTPDSALSVVVPTPEPTAIAAAVAAPTYSFEDPVNNECRAGTTPIDDGNDGVIDRCRIDPPNGGVAPAPAPAPAPALAVVPTSQPATPIPTAQPTAIPIATPLPTVAPTTVPTEPPPTAIPTLPPTVAATVAPSVTCGVGTVPIDLNGDGIDDACEARAES